MLTADKPAPRALLAALAAAAFAVKALSLPSGAEPGTPAATVDAFYRWYVAHHGRVENKNIWSKARRFFDPELYDLVNETYYKDNYDASQFLVRVCTAPVSCEVRYDPFANARSAATSYTIGATHVDGSQATVDLTLHLANRERDSHVIVVLRNEGGRYLISDLRFEPRGYYWAGPILNLKKFLEDFNC